MIIHKSVQSEVREWLGNPKLLPWYFLKYTYKVLLWVFIFFGLCFIAESFSETEIPSFGRLHSSAKLDPFHVTNGRCIIDGTTHEERFDSLRNALAILDKVNPAVSAWVRERNDSGNLYFIERRDTQSSCKNAIFCLAKFHWFDRTLAIDKGLFVENDGNIAVTLAHEYRHSRQHYTKMLRYALSTFWTESGEPTIVENDALLYEMKAYSAIFGPGYDDTD